jgi:hypothetical protein
MALKTLSKTNIVNGNIVQAADISQSIDAFTGTEGYAITLSGSFTFTGATTGSGYFSNAVNSITSLNASKLNPSLNNSTNANYNVLFAASSSATYETIYKEDGNIMTYNPSTNVLNVTSSKATSASYADVTPTPLLVDGAAYPSGSAPVPSALFRFIAGASKTGAGPNTVSVTINEILGKTLGQDCFVTATISGSGAQAITVNSLMGNMLTFETQNPNINFYYHILYI